MQKRDRMWQLKNNSLQTQTKRLLRSFNLQPKKELGQHFLIDEEVLKLIAPAADLNPNDVVVEIGPGLGMLTRELAKQAGWVFTVELDSKLADILKYNLALFRNVTIINKDMLKLDFVTLIREAGFSDSSNYKVAANLPYYITSLALRYFLESSVRPRIMVVMVQKEVAETIVAKPGQMSVLTISVQFYGKPKIISYVPAQCFYPIPEVDSAILRIDIYPEPLAANERGFFDFVRAGFSTPRKQICNSLANGLGLSKAEVLLSLEEAGIESERRAETLTLDEWLHLRQAFVQAGK